MKASQRALFVGRKVSGVGGTIGMVGTCSGSHWPATNLGTAAVSAVVALTCVGLLGAFGVVGRALVG